MIWFASLFAKFVPHDLLVKIAVASAIFLGGFAFGNIHATKIAIREADAARSRDMATVTHALIVKAKEDQAALIADAGRAHQADEAAHAALADKSQAELDRIAALAQLDKERAKSAKLEKTATQLGDAYADLRTTMEMSARDWRDSCAWSGRARVVLDAASGAAPSDPAGAKTAGADAARGSAETATAAAGAADGRCLTPNQLFRGYVGLAKHDRDATAGYRGWNAFFNERFEAANRQP